ncbi:hypothetical protein MSAN_01537400 [Mycena sanguinolenta]|uniref:Uncharacterized protein n=1 Tax=Mycena sanguinolenta TaxID=230812 RepID=A0A8H6Y3I7_9AGAR|nr:hypothetical protein MSAN_01537400 [Mycena sanguinolenta]
MRHTRAHPLESRLLRGIVEHSGLDRRLSMGESLSERENQRKAALEADPDCIDVLPYRVRCVWCKIIIRLAPEGCPSYQWKHWNNHKMSNAHHLAKGGVLISPPSSSAPRCRPRRGTRAREQRKAILETDPDSGDVSPHSVYCVRCDMAINLGRSGTYILKGWDEHKITGKHRRNGGTAGSKSDLFTRSRGSEEVSGEVDVDTYSPHKSAANIQKSAPAATKPDDCSTPWDLAVSPASDEAMAPDDVAARGGCGLSSHVTESHARTSTVVALTDRPIVEIYESVVSALSPPSMTKWQTILATAHDELTDSTNSEGLLDGIQTASIEGSSPFISPEDSALITRYRAPTITFEDKCLHHFVTFIVPGATSAIRQYNTGGNVNLYFASVGTGVNLRWGCVSMRGPASMDDIAEEFRCQGRDSMFSRTAYNHRRFILDKSQTRGESIWQSRFATVRKSHNGVDFDWITTPDQNIWVPRRHQLIMALDLNLMNPDSKFTQILGALAPFHAIANQQIFVEFLMVLLAVVWKFPTVEEKLLYLKHQRLFLENRLKSERVVEFSVYPPERRSDLYHRGLEQISNFFESISESLNSCHGYPSMEQVTAAREFGSNMAQWEMGIYRYMAAIHEQKGDPAAARMAESVANQARMGPCRAALKAAVYPDLEPHLARVAPEYAVYGCETRVKLEKFLHGELELLPDLSPALAALPAGRIL